jgi:hypothetical protein
MYPSLVKYALFLDAPVRCVDWRPRVLTTLRAR